MISNDIRKALQGKSPIADMEVQGYNILTQQRSTYFYIDYEQTNIITFNNKTRSIKQYNIEKEIGIEEDELVVE